MTYLHQSTTGSPRGLIRLISKMPRHCWTNYHNQQHLGSPGRMSSTLHPGSTRLMRVSLRHLDERSDTPLQDGMHHFQDKIPIHRCPVDILQLNSWTWCAIDPTDMSTDKALDVLRSRQFFHEGHFTPNVDHPLCHVPCCISHSLLYCATYPPSTVIACPVTNEAASEQSQTTASAISSGCPILPTGCRATIWASISGLLVRVSSNNGVRM
jgi:hypothetical protein